MRPSVRAMRILESVPEAIAVGVFASIADAVAVAVRSARAELEEQLPPVGQPVPVEVLTSVRDAVCVRVGDQRVRAGLVRLERVGESVSVGIDGGFGSDRGRTIDDGDRPRQTHREHGSPDHGQQSPQGTLHRGASVAQPPGTDAPRREDPIGATRRRVLMPAVPHPGRPPSSRSAPPPRGWWPTPRRSPWAA